MINPVAAGHVAVASEASDASTDSSSSSSSFLPDPLRSLAGAVQSGAETVGESAEYVRRVALYAGCIVYKGFGDFSGFPIDHWNQLAANKWATLGPRQGIFNVIQQGDVTGLLSAPIE